MERNQLQEQRQTPMIADGREFVASLEKGLAIIEAFGPDQPRLTLTRRRQASRRHPGRGATLPAHAGKAELC